MFSSTGNSFHYHVIFHVGGRTGDTMGPALRTRLDFCAERSSVTRNTYVENVKKYIEITNDRHHGYLLVSVAFLYMLRYIFFIFFRCCFSFWRNANKQTVVILFTLDYTIRYSHFYSSVRLFDWSVNNFGFFYANLLRSVWALLYRPARTPEPLEYSQASITFRVYMLTGNRRTAHVYNIMTPGRRTRFSN